jgi:hypothetical protein
MISRPSRYAIAVASVLLTLLSIPGCGSDDGPTAAEAGRTLKAHVLALLKEGKATNVTVTDPGGKNIACGEGRAKQSFSVTASGPDAQADPQVVKDRLISALSQVAPYRIVSDDFNDRPIEVENADAGTELFLEASADGQIVVRGQTLCLTVA